MSLDQEVQIEKLEQEITDKDNRIAEYEKQIKQQAKEIVKLEVALHTNAEPVAWRVPFKFEPDSKIEWALDCASDGKEYLLERVNDCDLSWIGEPEPLYTTPQVKPRLND